VNGSLTTERHDGVAVARLSGDMDISRAAAIRNELLRLLSNLDYGLVVDLREVTYLDSAGVNVLFEVAERLASRQQALTAVVPDTALIQRVLTLVNIRSAVETHPTLDAAVASIQALAPQHES
jgi:anti-sigma B factor antagonist